MSLDVRTPLSSLVAQNNKLNAPLDAAKLESMRALLSDQRISAADVARSRTVLAELLPKLRGEDGLQKATQALVDKLDVNDAAAVAPLVRLVQTAQTLDDNLRARGKALAIIDGAGALGTTLSLLLATVLTGHADMPTLSSVLCLATLMYPITYFGRDTGSGSGTDTKATATP